MSSSQELYTCLIGTLSALVSVTHIPGETQAESRVTTIRRWLKNFHVDVWSFYQPVLEQVLQGWQAVTATIILDGVMVWGDRWQIFRLSLAHGQRAIPLVWVLRVQPGQCRYFQKVGLTQDLQLTTNLSVTWTSGDEKHAPELLAVVSDQRACRARLREYGMCMDTEKSFRDDKSGGFEMAETRLRHAERLERLLLALAIAKLWCHELGEQVLRNGETARRAIDPGPERQLSIFQLGLRWLKRCVSTNIHQLPAFIARLSPLRLASVGQTGFH